MKDKNSVTKDSNVQEVKKEAFIEPSCELVVFKFEEVLATDGSVDEGPIDIF